MHGLVFVTWEKYLADTFGELLLQDYRAAIGETPANGPLASRVYDDATLLAGVAAANKLTKIPVDTLLHQYGRYFIVNSLTSHRCAYLLTQVHSGRDLLLMMRKAHAQMRQTPDALTPPLFGYEVLPGYDQGLRLIYDSPRQLCPLLVGAIEGAAIRYNEHVQMIERTCMHSGADACRFDVYYAPQTGTLPKQMPPESRELQQRQQYITNLVLSLLPSEQGYTWAEIHTQLKYLHPDNSAIRPATIVEALTHLQHAGLVASTSNLPGDSLTTRRFWRVPLTIINSF